MNLCFNAVDEMTRWPEEEREILISTSVDDDDGWFTVEDRGQGLQRLAGPSVFDQPFTSKEHGSGIGLALSHRIITRQHGQLFAWSREPGGAVFSFTLPLTREGSAVNS
jgi:signal transduction histidine kinase